MWKLNIHPVRPYSSCVVGERNLLCKSISVVDLRDLSKTHDNHPGKKLCKFIGAVDLRDSTTCDNRLETRMLVVFRTFL